MRLYAVIYSPAKDKTDVAALNGLAKAKSRIESLKKAVADSYGKFESKFQADPVTSWQLVFLAPEYFFSNRREMNDRFFSHEIKKYIIQQLVALGKQYPKMLIVPGTVLWTKGSAYRQYVGPDSTHPNGRDVFHAYQGRVDRVKQRIQNAANLNTDVTSHGWAHSGALGATAKPEDYLNDPSKMTRIAQNVAYVLLGSEILKYHKVGNYEEVMNEQGNIIFAPGDIVGRFDVGGVKYGIEVCMDHAQGVFNSSVATQGDVHIRLIVSSYVSAKTVSNTAVAIHASTMAQTTYLDTDSGNATTTGTNPIRITPGSGAKLLANPFQGPDWTLWMIDMDEGKLGMSNTFDRHFRNALIQPLKHAYT